MTARTVTGIHPALREDIGDLTSRRPLPAPSLDQVDPFLVLNHHGPQTYEPGNQGLPFGPHPHRGFETVTFILEGELAHFDSGGNQSVIRTGGVQWMTAGRGVMHAEISPEGFKRDGGKIEILQLWVNLPARLKMTAPAYTGLQAADIPNFATEDRLVTIELISGDWDGHAGAHRSLTAIMMSVLRFQAGGAIAAPAPSGRNVFLYVVRGAVEVGGQAVEAFNLVTLDDEGDEVEIYATEESILLFGHAQPCDDPVVAHGPFVMNTAEEIMDAVRDHRAGRFGRIG